MTIHKEGFATISLVFIIFLIINVAVKYFIDNIIIFSVLLIATLLLFLFIVRFFRFPKFKPTIKDSAVICPANGTIVAIEEYEENEYFNEKRLQISIFMSAWDVHINWQPISGIVKYFKYHPGKYLLALDPKSSENNERTTTVIQKETGEEILVRQVAGKVARRIVTYSNTDNKVKQCEQLGFIKFGSRVDVHLPLDAKSNVKLNQKVKGARTILAHFA